MNEGTALSVPLDFVAGKVESGFALGANAHLSRDKTAPKMGHPVLSRGRVFRGYGWDSHRVAGWWVLRY